MVLLDINILMSGGEVAWCLGILACGGKVVWRLSHTLDRLAGSADLGTKKAPAGTTLVDQGLYML